MIEHPSAHDLDLLERNLHDVRRRIAEAARRAGRTGERISLIAVTKTVPAALAGAAVGAGVVDLGENYVGELARKRAGVPGATWHFIGTLQSGTAHRVADLADVVQTVAGERAARRLAGRAARAGRTIDALIEVDLTGGRTGVPAAELEAFADLVAALQGLRLVGLMTMPPLPRIPEDSRPSFAELRRLQEHLRARHPDVLETSMGMSLDYEVAVEEGATMVRVGTALFGPRNR